MFAILIEGGESEVAVGSCERNIRVRCRKGGGYWDVSCSVPRIVVRTAQGKVGGDIAERSAGHCY